MPYNGGRLLGREIDFKQHHKAFAYACGFGFCDDKKFMAREIDFFKSAPIPPEMIVKPNVEVFAAAGECLEQPNDAGAVVNFVRKDIWWPFGITDVMLFKFISLTGYPLTVECLGDLKDFCPWIYIRWDGGVCWSGSFAAAGGALNVKACMNGPPDPAFGNRPKWTLTLTGCMTATPVVATMCIYPFKAGGQGFTIPTDCCPDETPVPPDVGFRIQSFTNRVRLAREIDRRGGKKVFGSAFCCDPDPLCVPPSCCGCAFYPLQWQLVIAGVVDDGSPPPPPRNCPCINGTWLLRLVSNGSGVCTWRSPVPTPGCGGWNLTCDGTNYLLGFDGGPGAGSNAQYAAPIATWNCLGPNVMTLVSSTGPCVWPATVTVTPA